MRRREGGGPWASAPTASAITSTSGGAAAASPPKVKPWEVQMDLLLQRLMVNSLHNDEDIRCVVALLLLSSRNGLCVEW